MKILIAEDIPSHNKGEAALFFGLIQSLKCFGNFDLTLFSIHPDIEAENYKGYADIVDARGVTPAHMLDSQGSAIHKAFNYINFWFKHASFFALNKIMGQKTLDIMTSPVWKAYLEADIVLISHDSFFTPLYHGLQALFCKLLKKPTFIYAGTVKPVNTNQNSRKRKIIDKFLGFALKHLTGITVRETLSKDYLASIGITPKTLPLEVYPDLAFILPPEKEEAADAILRKEGVPMGEKIVGMAFSQRKLDFAFPDKPNMPDRWERALEPIIEAVNYVTETLDADILFVAHSIGPTRILDDRVTADMIKTKVKSPDRLYIMRGEYTPMELKAVAAKLDMTIGTRLHFTIDAVCNNVPSVLITQDGDLRCHGIVGDMLEQKDYVYNIDNISSDTLIECIKSLWQNRDNVRSFLNTKIKEVKRDTYRNGEFIHNIVFGK